MRSAGDSFASCRDSGTSNAEAIMKIAIASDHADFPLKAEVREQVTK